MQNTLYIYCGHHNYTHVHVSWTRVTCIYCTCTCMLLFSHLYLNLNEIYRMVVSQNMHNNYKNNYSNQQERGTVLPQLLYWVWFILFLFPAEAAKEEEEL